MRVKHTFFITAPLLTVKKNKIFRIKIYILDSSLVKRTNSNFEARNSGYNLSDEVVYKLCFNSVYLQPNPVNYNICGRN